MKIYVIQNLSYQFECVRNKYAHDQNLERLKYQNVRSTKIKTELNRIANIWVRLTLPGGVETLLLTK